MDIKFCYYGDRLPCGYFDFMSYPEDAGLSIQVKVPDAETYIEAPVSVTCAVRAAASNCLNREHGRQQKNM